ncbi:hypothetical protein DICVIV_00013 [Dictyocaulus viviparus]|uniref:Uncharacterized protein n=1 Tax=Dictyocaulus viviparus TaxID=29172 RepID=A0A0D8YA03_DICVI|nr:hypothetical protein DICVIV_00013 [Dictyocaulus viviparus]
MCVRKKTRRSAKENLKTGSIASTPKSCTPRGDREKQKTTKKKQQTKTENEDSKDAKEEKITHETKTTQNTKGAKTKDIKEVKDNSENIVAKPLKNAPPAVEEKKKEPLHIKVPPPRVMKAKRPMKEVRSARDPEYKTLELDISEWESVKILKRSELNPDDFNKKDSKVDSNA